jgi:predicted alpha/beta-fold hydrolase
VITNLKNVPPFEAPVWCFNGHIHTIASSLFVHAGLPDCERIEIPTPDGDFLELDVCEQRGSRVVLVLFHGLEGSTDRYYIARLMRSGIARGYSAVAVNFRSCGSRLNFMPRFYHSGETEDYETVFFWIRQRFRNHAVGAVGFSLGANALLKSLGEQPEGHPADAAVAVSVPYDLKKGSIQISRGFNRIYEYRFLRTLRKKLDQKRRHHPHLPRFTGKTLYDFDDQVTSKIHGFDDAEDYYERCSSARFLPSIRTSTLLIHSRQDPLCPVDSMPMEAIRNNPYISYIVTDEGGHVGFWSRPEGWLNGVIMEFISHILCEKVKSDQCR